MKHYREFTVLALIALIAFFALMVSPSEGHAHTIRPSVCQTAWEQAPAGHKHEALVKCLKYVKAHNLSHVCKPARPILPGVKVKGRWADVKQRTNLTEALNGHRRTSTRKLVAMVAAIIQESNAYNNPWGHGTSVGILQLIDDHGTVAWRMKIINSTTWFISGANKVDRGQPIGDLAQDVQGSAHPTLYRQWVPEAFKIVAKFRGPCLR